MLPCLSVHLVPDQAGASSTTRHVRRAQRRGMRALGRCFLWTWTCTRVRKPFTIGPTDGPLTADALLSSNLASLLCMVMMAWRRKHHCLLKALLHGMNSRDV